MSQYKNNTSKIVTRFYISKQEKHAYALISWKIKYQQLGNNFIEFKESLKSAPLRFKIGR